MNPAAKQARDEVLAHATPATRYSLTGAAAILASAVEWLTGEVKPLRPWLNREMLEGCSFCW